MNQIPIDEHHGVIGFTVFFTLAGKEKFSAGKQCSGSRSVSFYASRIRILSSTATREKNLDFIVL
jgi:hypothetical protein